MVWSTLVVIVIVAMSVAMWLVVRRKKLPLPPPVPASEFAPGEMYRVRRTFRTAPVMARGLGRIQVALGLLVLALGIAELFVLRGRMAALLVSGAVITAFGMYAGGLSPSWVHDCLASAEEIVFFDVRGEVRFERASSRVVIERRANRIYPFRATLTRHDGKKRVMVIDEAGISVLRSLGWIEAAA